MGDRTTQAGTSAFKDGIAVSLSTPGPHARPSVARESSHGSCRGGSLRLVALPKVQGSEDPLKVAGRPTSLGVVGAISSGR